MIIIPHSSSWLVSFVYAFGESDRVLALISDWSTAYSAAACFAGYPTNMLPENLPPGKPFCPSAAVAMAPQQCHSKSTRKQGLANYIVQLVTWTQEFFTSHDKFMNHDISYRVSYRTMRLAIVKLALLIDFPHMSDMSYRFLTHVLLAAS